MTDLDYIRNNIAKCRERIAQIESGERGQIPAGHAHQNGGRALENQLNAQRHALERLELEYVEAMLAEHKWSPAVLIETMQRPVGPTTPELPVVHLKVGDLTRGRLQSLLETTIGHFIPRSKLQELLSK